VAATAPVPRPTHHLLGDGPTARWHSRATVGLCPDLPVLSGNWPELRRSFHSPYPTMVSSTAVHFELGPRSLDPAAVFAARLPSLFETRRRLTTSATALRRAGNQTLRLSCPRWDGGLDHLPFLNSPRLLPCESGDERRAARRPLLKTPVLVRPACASLPSRDTSRSAPPPPVARRCIARINVHGSKDRVKDASRSACDDVSCLRSVPTLEVA
jgi:hypothetical protein